MTRALASLRRHARLFRLYFRLDFFSSVFATFLGTAASFGFLLIVFSRVPAVRGWSFEEMVFLYGFSLIPLGIFNVLSWNLYLFSDRYLIEGRFDRVLVRPVNSVFQVLFEAFRLEALQETATGVAAVIWASRRLHLTFSGVEVLLFVL